MKRSTIWFIFMVLAVILSVAGQCYDYFFYGQSKVNAIFIAVWVIFLILVVFVYATKRF